MKFENHSDTLESIQNCYLKFELIWFSKGGTQVKNFQYQLLLVSTGGRSKNGSSHLKFILCGFRVIKSPHTKFHPNRMKNTLKKQVENFDFW